MDFPYNPRKAAQAAAYLVRLNNGRMDVVSLLKILYLADRKCLGRRGRPITGDKMYSMPHGPVLSRIYDQIKAGGDAAQPWCEYLTEREVNTISLRVADPPADELSEFERAILREEHEQYSRFSFNDLKRVTHSLPEYVDPRGGSLPIDPRVILQSAGWSDEEIRDAEMSAAEESVLAAVTRA
ncbi:MAG TPA: Panacea domain-containing protein [Candidatus Acidoferrum sp.]|nr:Panacea domain-containing protein [Candidatus Acidoferrum sp.]